MEIIIGWLEAGILTMVGNIVIIGVLEGFRNRLTIFKTLMVITTAMGSWYSKNGLMVLLKHIILWPKEIVGSAKVIYEEIMDMKTTSM